MKRFPSLRPLLAAVIVMGGIGLFAYAAEPVKDDPAVARTRKQALMLDDLYKTAIVLVTDAYVNEDSDVAAGSAFQALFKAMKEKGHHDVRLLDASGVAYDDDNLPREGFEKKAVKAL
ncbi:MAG: hypothetical protein KDA58_13920, partial [Planctomycetaceae bacterium]|nr:hypothetical protein [Planctomycetaceae bacterium]